MIACGAAITEVQNQLGHSNPSITLGIYSHWFRNAKAGGAAEQLAKLVVGNPHAQPEREWALRRSESRPDSRCSL